MGISMNNRLREVHGLLWDAPPPFQCLLRPLLHRVVIRQVREISSLLAMHVKISNLPK